MRQVVACTGGLQFVPRLDAGLAKHGVTLMLADTGSECTHLLTELLPDAVLLVVEPDSVQAAKACVELRHQTSAPLLVISTVYSQQQAVAVLEAGADDYAVFQDNYDEIVARLCALLRRAARMSEQRSFSIGDIHIDAESRTVRTQDREAHLTPLEFRLLACLASNAGKSLSPSTLLRAVQGYDLGGQEAAHVIKALVWRLRQKIETDPGNPVYVRNVRGSGYILDRRDLANRSTPADLPLLNASALNQPDSVVTSYE